MEESSSFMNWLVLMSFKIDAVIELLIKKGFIDKDELKELIHQKIDQGEDEEAKIRMKRSLDELLK
jgi:hypothetical protein